MKSTIVEGWAMFDAEKVDIIILAGGINRITLFDGDAPSYKALLSFGGKPCVQYVLDALENIPEAGRVCLVGPEAELRRAIKEPDRYEYAPGGRSFGESVFQGLEHFRDSEGVLFVTADLPLLTSSPVANFLDLCRRKKGHDRQIFFSAVDRRHFAGAYRDAPKRCSRFRDVTVCHGNLALLTPGMLEGKGPLSREKLDAIYRNRKKTLRTCWAFGWPFAVGYILGGSFIRLFTLEQVLRTASNRFRVELVPVFLYDPEIALDVDEPADFEFAKEMLARRLAEKGNTNIG
jgi:molybdopterin-guanine dinucleotide biosynthesis protein A